jgi:hypothetical protein
MRVSYHRDLAKVDVLQVRAVRQGNKDKAIKKGKSLAKAD